MKKHLTVQCDPSLLVNPTMAGVPVEQLLVDIQRTLDGQKASYEAFLKHEESKAELAHNAPRVTNSR